MYYLWKDVWSFQHFLFQTHYTSPSKFLFHNNSKQIPAHTPALHNEESNMLGKRALLYTYTTVQKSGVNTFFDKEVDKEVPFP